MGRMQGDWMLSRGKIELRIVVREGCGFPVGTTLGDKDFWGLQAILSCCRGLAGAAGGGGGGGW